MSNECPRCGQYHYFENEEIACIEAYISTNVEVLEDADITNPPMWIDEILTRTYYPLNDPNASWSLPK